MRNSERFLIAHNIIEKRLRKITSSEPRVSFYDLIKLASKSNASIRFYKLDLQEYGDLRNAIVHGKTDDKVIAEPNDKAVEEIEHLASMITTPPVIRDFMNKDVLIFDANQSIGEVIKSLYDYNFSQAPIYKKNVYEGLLTTDTIARWLGANVEEEIFSLRDTKTSMVLTYIEDPTSAIFLAPNTSIFEVLELFQKRNLEGKRIDAILVTHSGKSTESLLGIFTIWDLPRLHKAVEI
jgi:CBS domain-containing protein